MTRRLVLAACLAGTLAAAAPAAAQSPATLLTVGVDVSAASLTHAGYRLYVANRGNVTADAVVLSDEVPASTRFSTSDRVPDAASPCPPGAAPGTVCRWTIGAMPPGSSATVSVEYALDDTETYTVSNTAAAEGPNAGAASDTDTSLVRASLVLGEDTHVDDNAPDTNFGGCPDLRLRGDNAVTPFLDNDGFTGEHGGPLGKELERLWAAELRVTAHAVTGSLPVGVHRVNTRDWSEGAGDCVGGDGSGREARAPSQSEPGTEPQSDASPVATRQVAGPGVVRWDVLGGLDTELERSEFSGFELRAGSGSTALAAALFHSSEAASDHPRLVSVRTTRENPTCVDADAETGIGRSDSAQRVDAYVTDGDLRDSAAGADGCSGFPLAGADIGWELDDDDPDAWIASRNGEPVTRDPGAGDGVGPDRLAARSDAEGRAFVEVRLADPYPVGAADLENRVAAIALNPDVHDGATEPQFQGNHGVGEPDQNCSVLSTCGGNGEDHNEDDVHRTWNPVARPPAPTGTPPGGGGGEPVGSGTTSIPTPAPPTRAIALQASRARAVVGSEAQLTGRVASSATDCAGGRQFVEILRRRPGGSTTPYAGVTTAGDGSFVLPLIVDSTATYVAVAPAAGACPEASSGPAGVTATAIVRAATSRARRGGVRIAGRVVPAMRGVAVLERGVSRRWRAVARRRLGRRGTFAFGLRRVRRGATYRVRWIPPGAAYAGAVSRALTVPRR